MFYSTKIVQKKQSPDRVKKIESLNSEVDLYLARAFTVNWEKTLGRLEKRNTGLLVEVILMD